MADSPAVPGNGARILVVDDDADLLRLLSLRLQGAGYQVTAVTSAESALTQLEIEHPRLVLSDVKLPGRDGLQLFDEIRKRHPTLPVILLTAHGTIPDAVEATARGVFTYLTKPYEARELLDKIQQALALGAPAATPAAAGDESWRSEIVSRSSRMAEVLAEARMVAKTDASVLLRGDSGAGKEVLARAIHKASDRARKPFVAVNCGAIPEALLESELFGHVKGAFTDAHANHKGLFQQADGGTLLLDEIGEMDVRLQAKILRVLQEREVDRLGGTAPVKVDVRILAATNRDLGTEVRAGRFREDLLFRLRVVSLRLPALRDRTGDILPIAEHYAARYAEANGLPHRPFAPQARAMLLAHPWPGNVRELENAVHRAVLLAEGDEIGPLAIELDQPLPSVPEPATAAEAVPRPATPAGIVALVGRRVEDVERDLILETLGHCLGNRTRAAEILGISIRTLRNKLHEYRAAGASVPAAPGQAPLPALPAAMPVTMPAWAGPEPA